jgi:hypothetical protein
MGTPFYICMSLVPIPVYTGGVYTDSVSVSYYLMSDWVGAVMLKIARLLPCLDHLKYFINYDYNIVNLLL